MEEKIGIGEWVDPSDGRLYYEIGVDDGSAEPLVLFVANDKRVFDYVCEGAVAFFNKIFTNFSPFDEDFELPVEIIDDRGFVSDKLMAALSGEGTPVERLFEALSVHTGLTSDVLNEKRFRDEVIKKQVAEFELSRFATVAEINDALCPVESMFGLGHLSILSRGNVDMGIVEHHFKSFSTLEFFKKFSVAMWHDVRSQEDFGNGSLKDIDLDDANRQAFLKAKPNINTFWNLPYYSREFREFVLSLTPEECRSFVPETPRDVPENVFMEIVKKNRDDCHANASQVVEDFLWKDKTGTYFSPLMQKAVENFDHHAPGVFSVALWDMNIEITKRKSAGSGYRKFFREFFFPEPPVIDGKIATINEFNSIFAPPVRGLELVDEKFEDYLLLKVTELLGAHEAHTLFRGVMDNRVNLTFMQLMELVEMWDTLRDCPVDWWSSLVISDWGKRL